MNGEKIQELIEKMQMRRNAIWKDVETHSHTLSAPAQVHLIAEVTKIDTYIVELQGQLDDLAWDSFIQSLWEREYEDGTAKD